MPVLILIASKKLTKTTPPDLKSAIEYRLLHDIGKASDRAKPEDWLQAAILSVRDQLVGRWTESQQKSYAAKGKRVYYLSLEFLIGRLLRDTLHNLGLLNPMTDALKALGSDLDLVAALEPDAALGNGGLGRLAACFLDSMASLDIPAHGYGIRYRHGLFRQEIINGQQVERPEYWIEEGNPWEIRRKRRDFSVGFGGRTTEAAGRSSWTPAESLIASAYDVPIAGWRGKRVNTLRLWHAVPSTPFDLAQFNAGDHLGAQTAAVRAETINRVLYPADSNPAGHELRLKQQYLFVSASLQDILRRHLALFPSVKNLADVAAIQLNDTHPAIAIAELVRLLMDDHGFAFDEAFAITRQTCSYTNHTLLPEALETWPVGLMEYLLPRHMQIIYQINARVIADAHAAKMVNFDFLAAISLIDENNGRRVRMGQLAFAGSHRVNGVSALHSDLMKKTVFRSLETLYPGKIINKTNGVTPRRWMQLVNAPLTRLVEEAIGPAFLDDAEKIAALDLFATDGAFQRKFAAVKRGNKVKLAAVIKERTGISVDPESVFDVQIKRIHEYKRQQLAILETVALYNAMKANPSGNWVPRVKIFAGKAAASYWDAKGTVRLINDVGAVVNTDPAVKDLLKVVFIPNYNVSLAEVIVPAADISEQISTAGMEASGTGNMKLAMNGALTVGTLDGANVEISEQVGLDNIFIFGLKVAEVAALRQTAYQPGDIIARSPHLKGALDVIASGAFSPGEPGRHHDFVNRIRNSDYFLVAADFAAYSEALGKADALWKTPTEWTRKSIHNVARTGWFTSDRTIREYAREIWNVPSA
jgi:glycogen phosphorylase